MPIRPGTIDLPPSVLQGNPILARAARNVSTRQSLEAPQEGCAYTEWSNSIHYSDSGGHVYFDAHTNVISSDRSPQQPRQWVLISPLSARCNLACAYCYRGTEHSEQANPLLMDDETAETLIRDALAHYSEVSFIWHGGEPLLAGREFYERSLATQRKYAAEGQVFENLIQTNGTLLDHEWASFLKQHDFGVGLSVDGPAGIHNQHRPYANGSGSFARVEAAVRLLTEYDLDFGALAVVSKLSLGHAREIYDFLSGICAHFDFLPYGGHQIRNQSSLALDPADYGEFMSDLFDIWVQDPKGDIEVRLLANVVEMIIGGPPTLCSHSANCEHYVSVEANGDVYPCGRFSNVAEMKLGNVRESSLAQMLARPEHDLFNEMNLAARTDCSLCEWFACCNADCAAHRYDVEAGPHRSYFCESHRSLFEHVAEYVEASLQ